MGLDQLSVPTWPQLFTVDIKKQNTNAQELSVAGWSGRAIVWGTSQCRKKVGQGQQSLQKLRAGCFDIFSTPTVLETALFRLKYYLEGHLTQINQPTSTVIICNVLGTRTPEDKFYHNFSVCWVPSHCRLVCFIIRWESGTFSFALLSPDIARFLTQ